MFDVLVVGAGLAGAVLAARCNLSEKQCSICRPLLEAGPDYPDPAALPDDLRDVRGLAAPSTNGVIRRRPYRAALSRIRADGRPGRTGAMNAAAAQWGRPADFAAWGPTWPERMELG